MCMCKTCGILKSTNVFIDKSNLIMATFLTTNDLIDQLPVAIHRAGFGWLVNLAPLLILTTRPTNQDQTSAHIALEYRQHGSKIYLLAPIAHTPDWYQHLLNSPHAKVKLGHTAYNVSASPVTQQAEAQRALFLFRKSYTLTDQFRVIRLDVCNQPSSVQGISADRAWILPALLVTGAFCRMVFGRIR